jgi:hypothetical protein
MNARAVFFFCVAVAASAPFWPAEREGAARLEGDGLDWPVEVVEADWEARPPTAREARFARDFPGRVGLFETTTGRTVIVREVERATRKLHPAADCLRALGYAITPGPIRRDAEGRDWSTFTASRDRERLQVRERIAGADGRGWTDFSAWYWAVALGRAEGPWWATTDIVPLPSATPLAP